MDPVTLKLLVDLATPVVGTVVAAVVSEWFRTRCLRRAAGVPG